MKKSAIAIIALLMVMVPVVSAQDEVTPQSLTITIYEDGIADVLYHLESDPSQVRVDVELFGASYNTLVIRDDEGYALDSTPNLSGLSIDSLGASELTIQYRTYSLTTKDGPIWDLNITSPIDVRIILPTSAAIFDLGAIPTDLGMENGKQYLVLPSGDVYVSYILSFPNLGADAENKIADSENYLSALENQGYILTEAREELDAAEELYAEENYQESVDSAEQSIVIADQVKAVAENAQSEIRAATNAITLANTEGRTEGLDQAEATLVSAEASYDAGQYEQAETTATQAILQAQAAKTVSGGSNTLLYTGVLVVIAGAGGYMYLQNQKKTSDEVTPAQSGSSITVDYDSIMGEHRDLRLEDREVIKFLAENHGEAYASEIRNRFDLPRSSAWRLIRRLVGLEIIEEIKVGNQSLIRVQEKFWE